jgi:hypothetical protein
VPYPEYGTAGPSFNPGGLEALQGGAPHGFMGVNFATAGESKAHHIDQAIVEQHSGV